MLRSFPHRLVGSAAPLGVLAAALTACAEGPPVRPLAGQETKPPAAAAEPITREACGTAARPCELEGITVVVPRNG